MTFLYRLSCDDVVFLREHFGGPVLRAAHGSLPGQRNGLTFTTGDTGGTGTLAGDYFV
jgi:hypothetical protein